MPSTSTENIRVICPNDGEKLELDVRESTASAYAGKKFNGLKCPKCDYEI